MPFQIIRADLAKVQCDALVNSTHTRFPGRGGADAGLHRAAGKELKKAYLAMGGCEEGEAKATPAFRLPCKHVIHVVVPRWQKDEAKGKFLLALCYRNALLLAKELGCESVAIPLLATGTNGFPKELALSIAREEILSFLDAWEMEVTLVVYDKESFGLSKELQGEVQAFIEEHEVETIERRSLYARPMPCVQAEVCECDGCFGLAEEDLDNRLRHLDESFTQMLLRKIDASGMTDAQCYKKANIDRKLFSKIRKDMGYRPGKQTAIAFAIALELDLEETRELLLKAGYALSNSNKFDVIITYFIQNHRYDIYEINEVLFTHDQKLLGA